MGAFGTELLGSSAQQRLASVRWWGWFGLTVALTVAILAIIIVSGPNPASAAWLMYFAGMILILFRPRMGIYLVVLLTLAADNILLPAYPFIKNFTSSESLFHVPNSSLIFSPLETYLVLTVFSWLGRAVYRRAAIGQWRFNLRGGPLLGPVIFFTLFILLGLGWGLARGGDSNIALWEVRPILYLPLMFALTTNLIRTRVQVNRAIWLAMAGLFVVALTGIATWMAAPRAVDGRVEWVIEHGTAVRLNTVFVLMATAFVYRASRAKRIALPIMTLFALYTYVLSQRRAAILALALAFGLMLILLAQQNRRIFWRVAPPFALLSISYLAAFWNRAGPLGLPARAVRSVLRSSSGNWLEDASTFYRLVENINISHTLRQAPLTGVGFGHPFHIIVPMPDISFFEWWQYIPHNSILWIWIETGVFGFFAMAFLIGAAIVRGVRVVRAIPESAVSGWRDLSAIALTASLYVVMHFTYAYVDMAWDMQSMVYMGLMIGLINSLHWIAGRRAAAPTPAAPSTPSPVASGSALGAGDSGGRP
jgi:O-antigen ligase